MRRHTSALEKHDRSLFAVRSRGYLAATLIGAFIFLSGLARAQSQAGPITPPPQKTPQTRQAAQTPAPPSKMSVEVKLVYLYVTVRDKHGKIVPTLNQRDFLLNDDGRPQTITHFMRDSDVPLTLGLLADTSLSQSKVLDDERSASYKFLDQMLREGKDAAFVIHFDREVELLQDLTSSRPKLNAALQLLQTPQLQFHNGDDQGGGDPDGNGGDPDPDKNGGSGGQQRVREGGETLLYDAIYLASKDELTKRQGRKALFILSDGIDRGSKETLTDTIEAAQRSNTAVYSIYFAGSEPNRGSYDRQGGWGHPRVEWPGGGGGWPRGGGGRGDYPSEWHVDGKKILQRISTETGGQLFQVSKKLPLDKVFAEVEEELRNQYSLGYTPNPANTEASYHTINLSTQKKDLKVQVRDGYYSGN
jgi:VWFA-related protein